MPDQRSQEDASPVGTSEDTDEIEAEIDPAPLLTVQLSDLRAALEDLKSVLGVGNGPIDLPNPLTRRGNYCVAPQTHYNLPPVPAK